MKLEELHELIDNKVKEWHEQSKTGQLRFTFEVNMSQGGIGQVEVNVKERFK